MRTLTLAVALAVCHPGLASPHAPRPPATTSSTRPMPATQHFDFDDDRVEGSKPGPSEETVVARQHGVSPSLIHVREDFRAEMLRSADAM